MNDLSRLHEPFDLAEHSWRPGSQNKAKDKARALVYIDARNVMDRLDEVFGNDNWTPLYTPLKTEDDHWVVQCTITALMDDGRKTIKTDVGEGTASFKGTLENVCKEAYSDSLKRAAVQFGIGRYLYGLKYDYYLPIAYNKFTDQSMTTLNNWLAEQLGEKPPKQQPKQPKQQDDNPFENMPNDSAAHIAQPVANDADPKIALLRELRNKASDAALGRASKAQYGFLSSTIDKMFGGADVHKEVLTAIVGEPVSSSDLPSKAFTGFMLNKLLEQHKPQGSDEWVDNPQYDPVAVDLVKAVYAKAFNQS